MTAPADAGVMFFGNDAVGFAAAMAGNSSLGVEDFESSSVAAGGVAVSSDPVTQGVANGSFPAGLGVPMSMQSNLSGGAPTSPNPRGANGLIALGVGLAALGFARRRRA